MIADLGIQGCVEGTGALHDGENVRTLALIWRDDADLARRNAAAQEVRHDFLYICSLCDAPTSAPQS